MPTPSQTHDLEDRLQAVHNARDLGGLPTADGGTVRPARLLRSANLVSATAADVDLLLGAGVQDVVDLRADWELATAGEVPPAFTTHRVVLVADADRAASHEVLRTGGLAGYYSWIMAGSAHLLAGLVAILVEAPSGVLIQCGAGKDRTGVAVAVLLDLIGVADEHIGADYARTAAALRSIRSDLARTPGYDRAIRELPREAMGAPAEAITDALREVRATSGTVRDHLVAGGLDPALLPRLRQRLVTDQP